MRFFCIAVHVLFILSKGLCFVNRRFAILFYMDGGQTEESFVCREFDSHSRCAIWYNGSKRM